jgi:hypothetical protein
MTLAAGDGWEKLCPFLGFPVPETPFPRANTASERENKERANEAGPDRDLP